MKGPLLGGNNNSALKKEKKIDKLGKILKKGYFEEESTSKKEMKRKEKDAEQLETSKTAGKSPGTLKKKKKKHFKPEITDSETSGTTEKVESLGKTEKNKRKKHIGETIAEDQIVLPHEEGGTSAKENHRVKKRKRVQEKSDTAEQNNLILQQSSPKKKRESLDKTEKIKRKKHIGESIAEDQIVFSHEQGDASAKKKKRAKKRKIEQDNSETAEQSSPKKKRIDIDAGRDHGLTKSEETVDIKSAELNRVTDSTAGISPTSSDTKMEKKKRKRKPRRNWESSYNKKAKKVFESLLSKTTTNEDETTEEENEEETTTKNVPELPEQSKAAKKKKRDKSQCAVANPNQEAEEKPDTKEMSISYLQSWKENRENWHFQKSRQLWLIRNIYNDEAIDNDNFSLLLEYLEGSKGGIRTRLLQEAQSIHDTNSVEQHGTNSIKLSRAKEILQMLSE